VDENNKRYHANAQLYRKRQEINEHIFGTIKRQWGYNHTNLTGLEKVNGEHSLIMLVYNIKRSINILGVPDLIAKLKKWNSPYKAKVLFWLKATYLKLNLESLIFQTKLAAQKNSLLKRLYINCSTGQLEVFTVKIRFFHSLTLCRLAMWRFKEA
jgi:hypothetical protein